MADTKPSSPMRRATDVGAALLAILLVCAAVPAVLVAAVGNPLSGGLGHDWSPLARGALCVLVCTAWVAWIACCAQLFRSVALRVRRGDTAMRPTSPIDWLAARIAIGVLALTSIGLPLTLSSGAGAVASSSGDARSSNPPHAVERGTSRLAVDHALIVQPGEGLWGIAEAHLGDGAAWTHLAALNLGRRVSATERLVDPDQLKAGWRLRLPEERGHETDRRGSERPPSTGGAPDHLPELIALGLGSLTCAALARRSRRRFRTPPFAGPLDLAPSPSERAVDTATLLRRFDGSPALSAFEAANRLLGRCLRDDERQGPAVRLIQVGPTGVTFHLATAAPNVPAPMRLLGDGMRWHVDFEALEADHAFDDPYVPMAIPVGDDDQGTWLVALRAGQVLPLLGDAGVGLLRSARAAVESWDWSDLIAVCDDPADPRLVDPVVSHRVFLGRPDLLPADVAARTGVLTTEHAAASDLSILADRHGASIHPVGLVVHPHLLATSTEEDIAELCSPITPVHPAPLERSWAAPASVSAAAQPRRVASFSDHPVLAPGPIDVRLLTMTPRLDGLAEPLPPNRVRRAVELVAYLALHAPDVVTGDRLRTRVLGSTDADAASKTLFNVAHAARKALGSDAEGRPLFPAGSRAGVYQLSTEVTVDVQRAIAFVAAAKAHDDRDLSIAHYRAALDLVEGEPLANALAGYAWWETEGYGGRIAAVLVSAACSMATLATDAGHIELARWGLERARLVEPYSEALSRTAMEVAASEGDADRLRHEWRDCQRRVDALDPGSTPSPRTEALFAALSRDVLAGPGRHSLHHHRAGSVPID